ncbi:MAG TPA: hypothetical protein DDZ22_21580 [Massilia sp.]|nr:hypothetical protein [Massilia sp.]
MEDGMLKAIKSRHVETTVEYVRDLLERCERGEVTAVTVIEELPGGGYQYGGGSTPSRHATAGMLLDAAVERLQKE